MSTETPVSGVSRGISLQLYWKAPRLSEEIRPGSRDDLHRGLEAAEVAVDGGAVDHRGARPAGAIVLFHQGRRQRAELRVRSEADAQRGGRAIVDIQLQLGSQQAPVGGDVDAPARRDADARGAVADERRPLPLVEADAPDRRSVDAVETGIGEREP